MNLSSIRFASSLMKFSVTDFLTFKSDYAKILLLN
jgi:hypothetical protein